MVGTSANGCRYTRGLFCTNGFDQGCAVDDDAPIDATVNMPSATSPSAAAITLNSGLEVMLRRGVLLAPA